VIPVYCSATTLEPLFEQIKTVFERYNHCFEIICVDDSSSDQSWKVLQKLKSAHPELLRIVRLTRNFGQHNAILCGFNYVRGRFVVTLDDDLQNPPEEIIVLIKEQKRMGADLVYGTLIDKQHNWLVKLGSTVVTKITEHTFAPKGRGSSFRLITRSLVDSVKTHQQAFVYLDGLFNWYSERITCVPVRHQQRVAGHSGYTLKKSIGLTAHFLFNFTALPLKIITYLGLFVFGVSSCIGLYFIARKLLMDIPIGFTALIVSIYFIGGVILLVLGVMGEYLSRLYTLQNAKPPYAIRDKEL